MTTIAWKRAAWSALLQSDLGPACISFRRWRRRIKEIRRDRAKGVVTVGTVFICVDCGCSFVPGSTVAKRCKKCSHERLRQLDRGRKKEAYERGYRQPYHPRTPDDYAKIRAKRWLIRAPRVIKCARMALARINKGLDQFERAMASDYPQALSRAYRRANAKRLQTEQQQRKLRRRRALDPNSNRGHARIAPMVWSVFKEFDYHCAYCGISRLRARVEGHDLQLDHILPLTDPACVAGERNAAPACISCNASKGNRDLIVWARAKRLTPHPIALSKYNRLKAKRAA